MSATTANDLNAVANSGDKDIDGILWTTRWAVADFKMTYAFPSMASDYDTGAPGGKYPNQKAITDNLAQLGAQQQDAVRAGLEQYSDICLLTFTELPSNQIADVRLALSDDPNTSYASFPRRDGADGDAADQFKSGDVFFGNTRSDTSWQKGDYGFYTVIHELGHALGLSHPHNADGFGKMPERTDFMDNTVMSYRSFKGADPAAGLQNADGSHVQSLMPIDILAIQYLYGLNTSTRSAGTIYSWDPTTGEKSIDGVAQGAPVANRVYETIWDGGGIDTYDLRNYATGATGSLKGGASITLSEAQLAKVGEDADGKAINAGGSVFAAYDNGGFGICVIENARLGSGDDSLKGNSAANFLEGNDGADTLDGTAGMDSVLGGRGSDSLDGGVGDDSISGGDQADIVFGGHGGADRVHGGGGDDTLLAWTGADEFHGDEGTNMLSFELRTIGIIFDLSQGGQEMFGAFVTWDGIQNVRGTAKTDRLIGSDNANLLLGGGGSDDLRGLAGADRLIGSDDGDDTLLGGDGDDVLRGTAGLRQGQEVLVGGAGDDRVLVSEGADMLVVGGDDLDTLSFEKFADGVRVDLAAQILDFAVGRVEWAADFEVLVGGRGDDTLVATDDVHRSNVSSIDGGGGGDDIFGSDANERLFGGAGADELQGGGGNDTLDGGASNDGLSGDQGDDVLVGGNGEFEQYDGGKGRFDLLTFAWLAGGGPNEALSVDLGAGTGKIGDGAFTVAGIEHVIGGASGDRLAGTDLDETLDGGAGDDTLIGGDGRDVLIGGDSGKDVLEGGGGSDFLVAGGGADSFDGGGGKDVLGFRGVASGVQINLADGTATVGGAQITWKNIENLAGSFHDDRLVGDDEANRLDGGFGDDTVVGGDGDDIIVSDSGDDQLKGGVGNDEISTGDGDETVFGGAGDDTVGYIFGADALDGGEDRDLLSFALYGQEDLVAFVDLADGKGTGFDGTGFSVDGFEDVLGGAGSDGFFGDKLGNLLAGGGNLDFLAGRGGDDTLEGGDDDDILDGGGDDDMLKGGDGDDQFRFAAGDGADRIKGFEDVDRVDLTAVAGLADIDDLVLTETNAGLLVDYGDGTILLLGRVRADVDGTHFLFA